MDILNLIIKKRDKKILSEEEIKFFVEHLIKDELENYQVAALLMSIFLNGLNEEELFYLTREIVVQSEVLDLSFIEGKVLDKHSTGGIGDKVSLILIPILAHYNVSTVKMSGKGLSITGGTIDKLQSIKDFNCYLSLDKIKEIYQREGKVNVILGQMKNLAKGDKILYSLRDVTGTVDSIDLIGASIVSKKIASGNKNIVFDIKVGAGAFMKTLEEGIALSETMNNLVKKFGGTSTCVLSNMNEPLGRNIGNNLEVKEVIDFLKGNYTEDLFEVVLEIAYHGLLDIGILKAGHKEKEHFKEELENLLREEVLFPDFLKFIENQEGSTQEILNPSEFKKSKFIAQIKVNKENHGKYIESIQSNIIGEVIRDAGGGRKILEDLVEYDVGIVLEKKVGDQVFEGDVLLNLHFNEKGGKIKSKLIKMCENAFLYSNEKIHKKNMILKIIK